MKPKFKCLLTCCAVFLTVLMVLGFKSIDHNEAEIKRLNPSGYYPLSIQLGSSYQELSKNNPQFFEYAESGYGPGFVSPRMYMEDMKYIDFDLLNQDKISIFNTKGLSDLRVVNESDGLDYLELSIPIDPDGERIKISDKEEASGTNTVAKLHNMKIRYQAFTRLMDILRKNHWRPYIDRQSVRIVGKDSWISNDEQHRLGISTMTDAFYIDSFEKWQHYIGDDSLDFSVYKDGVVLWVTGIVDDYFFLNFTRYSPESIYMNNNPDEGIEEWRARGENFVKQSDVVIWAKKREEKEIIAKQAGLKIATDYIDMPLPK